MAAQGQGGVSVRFTQTGVEEMQKSVEGLNETIQQLAKTVAQLSGGEKELAATTQELNRVQNQVSVSSGLGNNALRRQLVSVSRLQGGIAALIPQLGSTSYAFRRVAIAAGGLLTINPAFAALAGAVAVVGLTVNHLQENARKAREEMEKLVRVRFQRQNIEMSLTNSGVEAKYDARWAVEHEGRGTEYVDEQIAKSQNTIDKLSEQVANNDSLMKSRWDRYQSMLTMGNDLLNNRPDNAADLAEWRSQERAFLQQFYKDATGKSWDGRERTDKGVDLMWEKIQEVVNYANRGIKSFKEDNEDIIKENLASSETIGKERKKIEEWNAERDKAVENDEKAEKQAERDAQSDLKAARDRETERQMQNAARIARAGDEREARKPLDLTQSDEELQKLITETRTKIADYNTELDRIERIRANTNKVSDEDAEKYAEATRDLSYAQAKLNEAVAEQERRASMNVQQPINPFEGFSATQTDLESHGADIGAGVGGSSIDDRLQKMSTYLQQIAENTKQDAIGVTGP